MGMRPERYERDRYARIYNEDDSPEEKERKLRLYSSLAETMGSRLKKRKGVLDCCRYALRRCCACGTPVCRRHTYHCVERGCRTKTFCERDWSKHLSTAH